MRGVLRKATQRGRDRALVVLAIAYFATVAFGPFDHGVRSSADAVARGQVWLLLTSALGVRGDAPGLQIAAAAAVAALVIAREGPLTWWVAAVAGHVLSAVFAYALIGVAITLGSAGADRAAPQPDFGVSCVLGGSIGAALVSGVEGLRSHRAGRRAGDVLATGIGVTGALILIAFSIGWYAVEHVLSVAIGAAAAWPLIRSPSRRHAYAVHP